MQPIRAEGKGPFLAICGVAFLAYFSYTLARHPVLPLFAKSLGAAPEMIGLIAGISTVTGVFVKLPAGALSDIFGRRRLLLLGLAFFALVPFAYSLVSSPEQLLAVRFFHGFATAIFGPVATATVASISGGQRGEKIGWYSLADNSGRTFGPFMGGALLFLTANNYHLIYLIAGVLGVLALLAGTRLSMEDGARGGSAAAVAEPWKKFTAGIREVTSSRDVVITSAMEAGQYLAVGALFTFLPLYAVSVGLNTGQIGAIFLAQGIVTMLARPYTGKFSDRSGRKRLIIGGMIVGAITLAIIPLTSSFYVLTLLGALFGLAVAIVTPSTMALVADLCRTERMGAAMGVFGTIWDVGEAAGPILAGMLIAWTASYFKSFLLIALLVLASALVFAVTVEEPSS